MARNKAFSKKNLDSGWRCTGVSPELDANQWLDSYASRHKIEMTSTPIEMIKERRGVLSKNMKGSSLEALDLAMYVPTKKRVTIISGYFKV